MAVLSKSLGDLSCYLFIFLYQEKDVRFVIFFCLFSSHLIDPVPLTSEIYFVYF